MTIKLNIYLLYWYFQQNQCLSIKKHAVHKALRWHWSYILNDIMFVYFSVGYDLDSIHRQSNPVEAVNSAQAIFIGKQG